MEAMASASGGCVRRTLTCVGARGRICRGIRNALRISDKRQRLKRHFQSRSQATYPCAFAYSYARIRRLVGFVPGLYRLWVAGNPATGFSDSTRYKFNDAPVCRVCDDAMVAVRGRPSGLPGLIPLGSLTRAQLPPLLV